MCNHRTPAPWGQVWNTYIGVGLLLELAGLLFGVPLTHHIRRLLGIEPRCGHEPIGRGAVIVVGIWAVLHFGWGRFNFGWPWPWLCRRRHHSTKGADHVHRR